LENGARERRELERAVVVDCRACRTLCEQALEALLAERRLSADDGAVRTVMSCAAVAEATASAIDSETGLAAELLEFCADACDSAAEALDPHDAHDVVRECSQACHGCADAVRALLWAAFEED